MEVTALGDADVRVGVVHRHEDFIRSHVVDAGLKHFVIAGKRPCSEFAAPRPATER